MRFTRLNHADQNHFAQTVDTESARLWSAAPWSGGHATEAVVDLAKCTRLCPVAPSKIVCVGRNYRAHAAEFGNAVPAAPMLFLKPPSSLIGPGAVIELPAASQRVEHEAELGIVIGERLRDADEARAGDAVFGLTCVNDVTARDLQRADVQFTRGKGFDTFCPCGPEVVTDIDWRDLLVTAEVNGVVRQSGRTSAMVFPVASLLSYISHIMTLEPGDLVATGTPQGVGPLCVGDEVAVEVAGVGRLANPVGSRQA